MPRKGIKRTHTGCETCKARRVKCDETQPHCIRCQSSGWDCEGYKEWVPKAYRQIQPSILPDANAPDLRSLTFFRQAVAPVLAGPIPRSFWTHTVIQISHDQPAIRNAVVCISSFFEGSQSAFANGQLKRELAISRYHVAIRQIAKFNQGSLDIVVIASVVFMSIELLRGNPMRAMIHYQHGRRILASYNASAVPLAIFRHVNVFVLCLSQLFGIPLLVQADFSSPPPFVALIQAQEALDWLTYRSMNVAYALDQSAANASDKEAFLRAQLMKSSLDTDLDAWSHDAALFTSPGSIQGASAHRMLHIRLLVCKIWTDPSLYRKITCTNGMFQGTSDITFGAVFNTSSLGDFLSSTGLSPVLYFMLMECSNLQIRLAALAILRKKCRSVDTSLDYKMLYIETKRAIENDHGVMIDSEWREAEELENLIGSQNLSSPMCIGFQFMSPWPVVLMDVCERVHQSF